MASSTSNGTTSSTLSSLTWDGTLGFRAGGGYRFADSDMELAATFTHFHAKSQLSASAPADGSLLGTLATDRRAKDATGADGDAGLSYAVVDLDVARSTRVSDTLDLRAFAGVRLASINSSLKSVYTGGALNDAVDSVNSPVRFLGAGLTAGADATWSFYRGWGLYGRGRVGLLSSAFDSHFTETLGSSLVSDQTDKYYTITPVAELGAGLSDQGERFFFRAGYEMTD